MFELRHVGCGSRYVAVVSVRSRSSVRAEIANPPGLKISGPHSNVSVLVSAAYIQGVRRVCPLYPYERFSEIYHLIGLVPSKSGEFFIADHLS